MCAMMNSDAFGCMCLRHCHLERGLAVSVAFGNLHGCATLTVNGLSAFGRLMKPFGFELLSQLHFSAELCFGNWRSSRKIGGAFLQSPA